MLLKAQFLVKQIKIALNLGACALPYLGMFKQINVEIQTRSARGQHSLQEGYHVDASAIAWIKQLKRGMNFVEQISMEQKTGNAIKLCFRKCFRIFSQFLMTYFRRFIFNFQWKAKNPSLLHCNSLRKNDNIF